jgi:hypothetical protein
MRVQRMLLGGSLSGIGQALILSSMKLIGPRNPILWDLLEEVWRRGYRHECVRYSVQVCEWSVKVLAADTCDVLGKQTSKILRDGGCVRPYTIDG